jgi:prolipoprotein diacylglyceryltransferase
MNIYGVLHASGILLWYYYFVHQFLPHFPEIPPDHFEWIFISSIPVAYTGARFMDYLNGGIPWADLFRRTPGLSFYGSAYVLPLYMIAVSQWYSFPPLKMLDALLISCCFLIITGRLANYFIGELNGHWSARFNRRHPSQLYECFSEGVLPFLLLRPYEHTIGEGRITLIWTGTYAVSRIICEFYREDDEMPQWYHPIRRQTGVKWLQVQAVLFYLYFTCLYYWFTGTASQFDARQFHLDDRADF